MQMQIDSRIEPVTVYQTPDGARWGTVEQAEQRLSEIDACAEIERRIGLRPVPHGTAYANGEGFVQQPRGARDAMYAALKELGANRDSDGPIGNLLYRAMRLDDLDREWGQAYFALNPDKGKAVEVSHAD